VRHAATVSLPQDAKANPTTSNPIRSGTQCAVPAQWRQASNALTTHVLLPLSHRINQPPNLIAVDLALDLMLVDGHDFAFPIDVLKPDNRIDIQRARHRLFRQNSVESDKRHR
jgi:hypothetical protein